VVVVEGVVVVVVEWHSSGWQEGWHDSGWQTGAAGWHCSGAHDGWHTSGVH